MNILVMGAGAMGSVFGAFLAEAGHHVHLVGREPHMAAVQEKGISVGGIWGEHLARNVAVHTSASQAHRDPFDLVLITTKAYDTERAAKEVKPLLGPGTLVVSIQNGLGNYEAISTQVGAERTIISRVIFGVDVVQEGRVEVTVHGGDCMLGNPAGAVPVPRIKGIARTFTEAGIKAEATEQIMGFVWGKLLYNCCLNPLSAILGVPYGHLLRTEETRAIMTSVVQESFAVAEKRRVPLLWASPEEYRRLLFEQLIPNTAGHYASMYADLKRGKRTEIDALNGAVARLGREAETPSPTNEFLTSLIKAREQLRS